ncbi:MAG: putative conserved domain protein [uncultured Solirubrobacteraceae bacterium]|uniref:Putative conserved domain protein n=1 Tax=uncultured Solirubrobacteraceae bacterium TaxID=1162706 RepID=A0A6J4T3F8_9ACTN|nr:MAG: putative conserved domain protein [uncultured Solirubrobacteraceae bacterium]
MRHSIQEVENWIGQDLTGADLDKVGTIKDIYLDAETDEPEWLAVSTGAFGGVSFVPLAEAERHGQGVRVPYDKATIKSAPTAKPEGELSQSEEEQLYDHYGLVYGGSRSGSGLPEYEDDAIEVPVEQVAPVAQAPPPAPPPPAPVQQAPPPPAPVQQAPPPPREPVGHDVSGPTTDDAMTRSEEELHVGKAAAPVGRARLRKYVVTEHVQTTVPVQREEVRVEREPVTDADVGEAMDGPPISEEEHEVVLYEEEPVVEKRVVPKERVRMGKEVVTDEQTVTDEIRKEQIEVQGVDESRTR